MLDDFIRALGGLNDMLVERHPDAYGGMYATNSGSLDMTILVVGDESGVRDDVLRTMEVATRGLEPEPRITFAPAERPLLALRDLANRLGFTEMKRWQTRGLQISAVGIDMKANLVAVTVVRPDSAVLAEFLNSMGDDREMIAVHKRSEAPRYMASEHAPYLPLCARHKRSGAGNLGGVWHDPMIRR